MSLGRDLLRTAVPILASLIGACGPDAQEPEQLVDASTSLYALVETIDGASIAPPLGPDIAPIGAFDATQLGALSVALEATDAAGLTRTLATFDARSTPPLILLAPHELYFVNVPAAAYFTDPALAYRFRVSLAGREIVRSDMTDHIFTVLRYVPAVHVGVKLRLEGRAAPVVSSLTPSTVTPSASDLVVTASGTGFVHDTVLRVGGQDLATTFVSGSTLHAVVPAALLGAPGSLELRAFTPAPGGGTSNGATLVVSDPTPALASISPATAVAGAPAFVLTLEGAGFMSGATAWFQGAALVTTVVSSTRLTAAVPAAAIAAAGSFAVTATNPSSSPSAAQTFVVGAAPSGLVHYWPGDGSAADLAGAANGTVVGATFTAAHRGPGFQFDGTSYVDLPTDPTTLGLTHGTLSLWFQLSDPTTNTVRLFEVAQSGPAFPYASQWTFDYRGTGQLQVSCYQGGGGVSWFTSNGSVTDTRLHHAVVVADGVGPMAIYIDGVARTVSGGTSRFFGNAAGSNNMKIGAIQRNTIAAEGRKVIDEVRIYNRALSATEVQTLYTSL